MTTAAITEKRVSPADLEIRKIAGIGYVVEAIREGLSVSVAELAKVTGIRRSRIEAIERGSLASQEDHWHIASGAAWLCNHAASA